MAHQQATLLLCLVALLASSWQAAGGAAGAGGSEQSLPGGSELSLPGGSELRFPGGSELSLPGGSELSLPGGSEQSLPVRRYIGRSLLRRHPPGVGMHPKGRGHHRYKRGGRNSLGSQERATIVVPRDYSTIQKAIDAAKPGSPSRPTVIFVQAGVYVEQVHVTKSYLMLVGELGRTRITQHHYAADGKWNSYKGGGLRACATLHIDKVVGFTAVNLIVENTYGWNGPAVALVVAADQAQFYGCSFLGYQDVLFSHSGRHYFKNCFIRGSVDFVFGSGKALFHNCHLYGVTSKLQTVATGVAQKRVDPTVDSGFVILGGSFTSLRVPHSNPTNLGRAWGDYAIVIFANVYFDKTIDPEGWSEYPGFERRRSTAFLAEYRCWGPGASRAGRLSWAKEIPPQDVEKGGKWEKILSTAWVDPNRQWIRTPKIYSNQMGVSG